MKKLVVFLTIIVLNTGYSQVAVFPFEDLSRGINGINMEIPCKIAQRLKERGFSIVQPEEVVKFLSKYHVLWTGWIDRVTADRVKRELNSQYALLGTVLEFNPKTFSFALTLRMLDLEDYKPIWSYSTFFSKEDNISFLNLRKRSWDTCLTHLIDEVVSHIPSEILRFSSRAPVVDVSRCFITPRYAKPGTRVSCRIKLESSGPSPDRLVLKVEKVGEVPIKKEGSFYEASWIAPSNEGRFGVSLEISWKGFKKKRIFLGTYSVDKTPPSFHLKLSGIRHVDGLPVMRDYVKIIPSLRRNEDVDRWRLEIDSEESNSTKKVLSVSSSGYIPPWFVWRGQTGKGSVPNGRYTIRLTVWDKAGNSYTDEKSLLVINNIGDIQVDAYKSGKDILLKLRLRNYPIGLRGWRITLWSEDGELFQEKSGDSLPDMVKFPGLISRPLKEIYCLVELVDKAGNRWAFRRGPLKLKVFSGVKSRKKGGGWVSDF